LDVIDHERESWDALLAEVGEERMLVPGPMGEWSFKDLIAHLMGWRERGLQRLEAAAQGQPEPPPAWPAHLESDDEINAWIHEANRDRPLADVVADSRRSYARLAEIVRSLPDEALTDPASFPWLEGQALGEAIVDGAWFGHLHEEHEPTIRQWLQESN
jgi:hypothetical protein